MEHGLLCRRLPVRFLHCSRVPVTWLSRTVWTRSTTTLTSRRERPWLLQAHRPGFTFCLTCVIVRRSFPPQDVACRAAYAESCDFLPRAHAWCRRQLQRNGHEPGLSTRLSGTAACVDACLTADVFPASDNGDHSELCALYASTSCQGHQLNGDCGCLPRHSLT